MALFGLTEKAGALIQWLKFGSLLSGAKGAAENYEKENPMTWKQAFLNAGKHALYSVGAVALKAAGTAALHWYVSGGLEPILSADLTPAFATAVIPLLHFTYVLIQNGMKVAK